jgi:hypothetical protein
VVNEVHNLKTVNPLTPEKSQIPYMSFGRSFCVTYIVFCRTLCLYSRKETSVDCFFHSTIIHHTELYVSVTYRNFKLESKIIPFHTVTA